MTQRSLLLLASVMLVLTASSIASAQTEALSKGQVIEKVICQGDQGQSYALYLPSSYTPEKKWPLLIAFDPIARGRLPVNRFKDAAEKYGYIVIGSNNSRNGPLGNPSAAFNAMWTDALARFSINERRIYATGFSGGARVASSVGLALRGRVQGVILCGAGFHTEANLADPVLFAVFITAGTDDFNYVEVKELGRKLDQKGVAHRVEIFEGGHEWASAELCTQAIEWMEMQAMKSGLRDKDEKLIDELFKREIEKAEAHQAAGRFFQAFTVYEQMARDFKGLKDVSELESKTAQLKETKQIKQAIKAERDAENDQIKRTNDLFRLRAMVEGQRGLSYSDSLGATTDTAEGHAQAISELRRVLADLKKKADAKDNTLERAVARRALNQYTARSFETAMALLDTRKYNQAIATLSIDADTMPENWRVLYNLACAYALAGDKKRAIETLKKAVDKGFADAGQLERNPWLDSLREEDAFKKIVEELGRSKK